MNNLLKWESENIRPIFFKIIKQSFSYLDSLDNRNTSTDYSTGLLNELPEDGLGTLGTLKLFNEKFEPGIIATSGPRYLGFAIGGTTPAAIAADWLTTVYDQIPFASHKQSGIAVKIEQETIKLLRNLLGLPDTFSGGFVSGATMSNFTGLAVARQWWGQQYGMDIAKEGFRSEIKIFAGVPHSSVFKSLSMLGIGSRNMEIVNTASEDREAIGIKDLIDKIERLNGQPFILISSAGTVNTVDFDDLLVISLLKRKFKFWWHIDAAFGAFAACSTNYSHLLNGWEYADSIAVDCHKWLNVPYESAVAFLRNEYDALQVNTFQNSNAPYLGNPSDNFSYMNFLPENSRRLKALPAWFTIMAYGKAGYNSIVDNCIDMALQLGNYIAESKQFELLAPVRLNTVCFTLSNNASNEKIDEMLTKINNSKKVFMTPTVLNGKKGIRAAFVNWRTSEEDVEIVKQVLKGIVIEI